MTSLSLINRNGCPMCSATDMDIFIPFPQIPVVKCRNCDFTYSGKILAGEDLASYYENNFGGQRHQHGQQVNALTNMMALGKLIDLARIGSVLDVGTGYGYLLQELRARYSLEVTGVELSKQEASYAQNTLELNVVNSLLSEAGLKKDSYDLVASFEVIEHVSNPLEFIQELTGYVKPGGYLIIMTDNFDSHVARALGAGFPKWIPHTHISHFSSVTLRRAIEATTDLKLIRSLSYTPWEFFARNAFYKIRGIKKSPQDAFKLETTLADEMTAKYPLFALRKLINRMWARLTIGENMDGALMYFLAQRIK